MQEIKEKYFEGERALYGLSNTILKNVTFGEGESPLKETKDLEIKATIFKYKYPLWYSNNINITDAIFETMSRSGIWYTDNISIKNSNLQAPKLFRRCKNITLDHIFFSNAEETMWSCEDITIKNTGRYFFNLLFPFMVTHSFLPVLAAWYQRPQEALQIQDVFAQLQPCRKYPPLGTDLFPNSVRHFDCPHPHCQY